ncbi:hypothetical protein PAPYR_8346 [Paratrimastix pyriformis]|uniref:Uncharacterized protein n=1 Tax=Paratrimastix pyriformis TaxID=342808 RepID=A0ABQ8UAV8_9EUKA|nr:hypothetical protein PAPYR_8346 [Paratrimastix pyriformis]
MNSRPSQLQNDTDMSGRKEVPRLHPPAWTSKTCKFSQDEIVLVQLLREAFEYPFGPKKVQDLNPICAIAKDVYGIEITLLQEPPSHIRTIRTLIQGGVGLRLVASSSTGANYDPSSHSRQDNRVMADFNPDVGLTAFAYYLRLLGPPLAEPSVTSLYHYVGGSLFAAACLLGMQEPPASVSIQFPRKAHAPSDDIPLPGEIDSPTYPGAQRFVQFLLADMMAVLKQYSFRLLYLLYSMFIKGSSEIEVSHTQSVDLRWFMLDSDDTTLRIISPLHRYVMQYAYNKTRPGPLLPPDYGQLTEAEQGYTRERLVRDSPVQLTRQLCSVMPPFAPASLAQKEFLFQPGEDLDPHIRRVKERPALLIFRPCDPRHPRVDMIRVVLLEREGIVWGLWSSILYLPSVRQRLAIRFHASRRLALVPLASMPFDVQRKWWEGIVAKEGPSSAPRPPAGLWFWGPSREEQVQPEDESIFAGASYISLPPARMLYWWRLAGLFIGAAASSSWSGGYPTVVWLALLALAAFLVRKLTIVVLAPYLVFPAAIWLFQTDVRLACSLPFGLSCALFPCALWVRTWGAKPRAHRLMVGHYVGLGAFSLPLAWRTIGVLPAVTFLWLIIVPLISDSRLPREVVLFAALCYGLVMCIINSYFLPSGAPRHSRLSCSPPAEPLIHRPTLVRRERKIVRPLRILAGILAVLCFAAGSCGLLAVPTHGVAPIVAFATALSLGCLAAIRGWSHALLLAALPCAIAAGVGLGWVGPATTAGVAPWSLFGLPALGVALWAWAVSAMVLTHPAVVRRILARSATFSFRTLFRAIPDAFSRAPPPSAPQPPQPDKSLAPQGAPPAPSRPLYAVLTPGHLAMALLCRSAAFLGIATIVGTGFWVGALLTWEVVLPAAAAVPFLALMGSWGLFSAVAPSSDAWGWASLVLLILCSLCAPCFAFGVFPRIRMFPTSGIHNEQAADLFVLWALVGIRAYTVTRGFAPLIVALLVVGASWHTRVPWFLLSGPALLAVSALPLHWAFGDPAWAGFPWSVRWVTGLLMACLAVVLWAALRPRPVRRLTCPHWVFIPVTSLVQATPVARPATNVPGLFVIPIPQSGPPAAQPLAPLPPPEKDAALFRDHSTSSLETGSASSLSMALPGAAHLSPPLADSSPWPVPAGPSEPSNISTDGLVLPFAEPEHPAMPPILLPSAGPQPLSPSFHSLATATRRFATFPSRDSCFSPDPAPLAPAVLNRLSARFPPTALPWGSLASSRTPRSPSAPSLADSSLSRRKSISSLPLSESFHEPISEEMASGDGATAMAVPPARPPRAGDEGSEMSDLDGPAPPLAPATAPTSPPSPLSETSSDSSLTLDAGEEPGTPTAGLGPARLQHPVPRRSALYMAPTTKKPNPPPRRAHPHAGELQAETPGGGNRAGYLGPSFEGLPQKLRDVFAYYQWLSIRSVLGRPLLEETFLHLVDVACFVQLSCGVGLIASHPDALWLTPAVVSLVGLLFGVWGLLQPRVWWYVVMGAATIVGACSAFFAVGLPASVIGPTVGYVLAAVMLGVAQFRFRWRQRQRPPAPVASPPPPPASPQPVLPRPPAAPSPPRLPPLPSPDLPEPGAPRVPAHLREGFFPRLLGFLRPIYFVAWFSLPLFMLISNSCSLSRWIFPLNELIAQQSRSLP